MARNGNEDDDSSEKVNYVRFSFHSKFTYTERMRTRKRCCFCFHFLTNINEPELIMSGTQYLVSSCNRVRNGWMFVVTDLILAGGRAWQGGRAWWGACMAVGHAWKGGWHAWWGHAWQGGMHGGGACVAGDMHGKGEGMHGKGACVGGCMAGGHVWQGNEWQGVVCGGGTHGGGGRAWQGACMAGGRAWQILRDTVNERPVRILLECTLV